MGNDGKGQVSPILRQMLVPIWWSGFRPAPEGPIIELHEGEQGGTQTVLGCTLTGHDVALPSPRGGLATDVPKVTWLRFCFVFGRFGLPRNNLSRKGPTFP